MTVTLTGLMDQVQRTLLIRAKNHAGLLDLVAKDHIDPIGTQAYPVITVTDPRALPRNMTCARGADGSFDVHAFCGPKADASMNGRQYIKAIGTQIETVFAPNEIALEDNSRCKLFFSDVRILKDAAPDDWHWFGQLNIAVLKAIA